MIISSLIDAAGVAAVVTDPFEVIVEGVDRELAGAAVVGVLCMDHTLGTAHILATPVTRRVTQEDAEGGQAVEGLASHSHQSLLANRPRRRGW
jgi:hypothetical protein